MKKLLKKTLIFLVQLCFSLSLALVDVIIVQTALQEGLCLGTADGGGRNSSALAGQRSRPAGQAEADAGHRPQLACHAALAVDADVFAGQGGAGGGGGVGPR